MHFQQTPQGLQMSHHVPQVTLLLLPPSLCALPPKMFLVFAWQPFMTSTAPTPKGPQEQSLTEKRLQELLAKRADVVAGGLPDRNIQVRHSLRCGQVLLWKVLYKTLGGTQTARLGGKGG